MPTMVRASTGQDLVPRDDTGGPARRPAATTRGGARAALAAALVPVATAVALTGCGGQAREVRDALTYTGEVNRVQAAFERDLRELRTAAGRAEVPADVRRAVDRLSRSISRVQADLRGIAPPPKVAGLHRDLIAAFGRWTAPLQRFRTALRKRRTTPALQRAQEEFVRDSAAVERGLGVAARRINDRLRRLSD